MIMALKRAAAPTEEALKAEAAALAAKQAAAKQPDDEAKANDAANATSDVRDDAPPVGEVKGDEAKPDAVAEAKPEAKPEPETAGEPEPEAKPQAEAKPEVKPEEIKPREVAVVPEGGAVITNAERHANASEQFTQDMAAQGYEGLAITGMSFDRLKLHEAKFQLGSEEISLGEQIDLVVLSTRNIYVVRQYPGEGAEMFYSYDKRGLTLSDGTSSKDTLDKWLDEGYGTDDEPLDIKEYIEAMSQLKNRDDEYNDHMVSLSIPPASKARLAGAMAVGIRKHQCAPGDLVLRCSVGKKVGTGEKAFRPWNFAAIGDQNVLATE
jgi:hypothetical protein